MTREEVEREIHKLSEAQQAGALRVFLVTLIRPDADPSEPVTLAVVLGKLQEAVEAVR